MLLKIIQNVTAAINIAREEKQIGVREGMLKITRLGPNPIQIYSCGVAIMQSPCKGTLKSPSDCPSNTGRRAHPTSISAPGLENYRIGGLT